MESLEPELRRVHIEVSENTTEEEILEQFRQAKADLLERRRQRVLWDAANIMSSYRHRGWTRITSTPTLQELRNRLEQLPPKAIKERIRQLRSELSDHENFETALFLPRLKEQIPVNWEYMAATKEEYVAILKKRNRDHLETVKQAIPYLKEIISLHRDVLNKKIAFLKQHEPEVPGLVQECSRLVKEADAVKRQVMELLGRLERTSNLKDRNKLAEKTLTLIRKHRDLEVQYAPVFDKLVKYTVDERETLDSLPGFESSRYNLPLWLQVKLERGK